LTWFDDVEGEFEFEGLSEFEFEGLVVGCWLSQVLLTLNRPSYGAITDVPRHRGPGGKPIGTNDFLHRNRPKPSQSADHLKADPIKFGHQLIRGSPW
jgi:hypothetical protein